MLLVLSNLCILLPRGIAVDINGTLGGRIAVMIAKEEIFPALGNGQHWNSAPTNPVDLSPILSLIPQIAMFGGQCFHVFQSPLQYIK